MPIGRPTDYTPEIAADICSWIARGKSLQKFCEQDGTPDQTSVYRWLSKFPEFLQMYTRAREDQADTHADGLVDLSDTATPETVHVVKLQTETRKWIAAKLKPRKYGDRTTTELTGADGGPIKTEGTGNFDALLGRIEAIARSKPDGDGKP